MIPKIIWQTHEWDYEDLPEVYKKTTSTWQKLNPDWEYRYLNASQRREMVKNIRPSLLDRYDGHSSEKYNGTDIGGMLQCDLWRVACIYEYGGVYADLDAICIGTLDQMIDLYSDKDIVISSNFLTKPNEELFKDSVLGINYDFKVNSGAGFAGKKNSVVLKEMLDILEGKKEYTENFQSDWAMSHNEWEIFNGVCTNSNIDLISYDFRWSVHSYIFNHKHSDLSTGN
jgi:mannosyltransferase OCH1-like enzyme